MPLSISVVMTSCAPVRALRKPGMNPYAAPAMVPPNIADHQGEERWQGSRHERRRDPGAQAADEELALDAEVEQAGVERDREAQAGEDERRRADQGLGDGSKGGRDVVGVAALDRGDDATRVADRAGEHRRVAVEHASERAADRCERIGADMSQVLEVGQHDEDRAQEEGRDQGECRVTCAAELIADSLHVAQCRPSNPAGSGTQRSRTRATHGTQPRPITRWARSGS